MRHNKINAIGAILLMALTLPALPALAGKAQVLMETTQGNITIELDGDAAPRTVENFLSYVDRDFYADTVFHRVIKGFMIQGGGMDTALQQKKPAASIVNEADNGLKNVRGSIAMARTSYPHSATSQFFINLVDNQFLNFSGKNSRGWGYTVFGRVINGMDVVDKIAKLPTAVASNGMRDVPVKLPIIKRVSRIAN